MKKSCIQHLFDTYSILSQTHNLFDFYGNVQENFILQLTIKLTDT